MKYRETIKINIREANELVMKALMMNCDIDIYNIKCEVLDGNKTYNVYYKISRNGKSHSAILGLKEYDYLRLLKLGLSFYKKIRADKIKYKNRCFQAEYSLFNKGIVR